MFRTLSARAATLLDQELMSTGAFSIDQLMELAGLAVAQAVYKQYPSQNPSSKVLVLVGPGNNGGDGLVAARHLKLWGAYEPVLYYPKKSKNQLYSNLLTQLKDLKVGEVSTLAEIKQLAPNIIIDSLFGFSFKPPIRDPFNDVIAYLATTKPRAPIVSVDIPSGWDVDNGPSPDAPNIDPEMLISLTAPKPCARFFQEDPTKVHYLGGRFINQTIAQKYDIEDLIKLYKGNDLIVKL